MWNRNSYLLTTPSVAVFAASHPGRMLSVNEDRFVVRQLNDGSALLAVADGLGGVSCGAVAAEMVRHALNCVDEIVSGRETQQLDQLARRIDKVIMTHGQVEKRCAGLGSTLLAVLIRDSQAHWVHVGDSRLFHMHAGKLTQVTQDQTLARFLLNEGEISTLDLATHYSRQVMDQWVGCGYCEPDTGHLRLLPADKVLVATDGLFKTVPAEAIAAMLAGKAGVERQVRKLIRGALKLNAGDNITGIVAEIIESR